MHIGLGPRKASLTPNVAPRYIRRGCVGMAEKRKFLGIVFQCCRVYARVYINKQNTAYNGMCPRCGKRVEFKIGRGGTDSRFFNAY